MPKSDNWCRVRLYTGYKIIDEGMTVYVRDPSSKKPKSLAVTIAAILDNGERITVKKGKAGKQWDVCPQQLSECEEVLPPEVLDQPEALDQEQKPTPKSAPIINTEWAIAPNESQVFVGDIVTLKSFPAPDILIAIPQPPDLTLGATVQFNSDPKNELHLKVGKVVEEPSRGYLAVDFGGWRSIVHASDLKAPLPPPPALDRSSEFTIDGIRNSRILLLYEASYEPFEWFVSAVAEIKTSDKL